jgi:stage II sporulation protein D
VRVGIAVGVTDIAISAQAPFEIVVPATGESVRAAAGESWSFAADGDGQIVGRGPGGKRIGPVTGLLRVQVPGGREPVLIGGQPYRGGALLRGAGNGRVTAINIVDLESYLLGVVPLEIGRGRPAAELEAVKAQAVAARTYAVRHLGGRESLGFDFYATISDQAYGGVSREDPMASRAVRETAGEIVTYQGAPILAYYHSTCGGRTAAIEESWRHRAPVPYLKSVSDEVGGAPGRYYCESSSRFRWDVSWSGTELRETLARTLAKRAGRSAPERIRRVEGVEVRGWTPSRRAKSLIVNSDAGRTEVPGDSIRWVLEAEPGRGLNSTLFVLDAEERGGEVVALRARGGGWGHGIAMCQVGALGRARAGQDYRRILTSYYLKTEVTRIY